MADAEQALSFAPAELEHLPALIKNETRSYAFPWTEGVFRDCIAGPQDCWAAFLPADSSGGDSSSSERPEQEATLIGHAILSVISGEAHLLNLCISRDRQGYGYGRQFMRFILKKISAAGAQVMFLEVRPSNRVAIALYESMGFREIGVRKDYYPAPLGREDARVLALQFPAANAAPSSTEVLERKNLGQDHFGAV